MQTFVQINKLHNIRGRADYISNPERQEDIVISSLKIDWQPYHEYEKSHRKSFKENNEGRELIIALPNEWATSTTLDCKINLLAEELLKKNRSEFQWAVHWNKDHTNLHVHIIFSERTRKYKKDFSTECYDRDIYLTSEGKIARRKADRAKDENGNIKPPVHRKGELKNAGIFEFTPKDKRFKSKQWLENVKNNVVAFYKQYGVQIDERGLFHQYHQGKGSESTIIKQKNHKIKEINTMISELKSRSYVFPSPNTDKYYAMYNQIIKNNETDIEKFALVKPLNINALITKINNYISDFDLFERSNKIIVNTLIIKKLETVQKLIKTLSNQSQKIRQLNKKINEFGMLQSIFKHNEKNNLIQERNSIAKELEKTVKQLNDYEICTYYENHDVDCSAPSKEHINSIIQIAEKHNISKLQKLAKTEQEKLKVLEQAKKITPEYLQTSLNSIQELCSNITPSEHSKVLKAVQDHNYQTKNTNAMQNIELIFKNNNIPVSLSRSASKQQTETISRFSVSDLKSEKYAPRSQRTTNEHEQYRSKNRDAR